MVGELDVALDVATEEATEGGMDTGVVLTVKRDVGVGGTAGAVVGAVVGLETGLTGAAVFWKQEQALDKREVGTPAKLLGTCWFGALRNLGQKTAASLEKRSKARRVLSS